VEPRGYPERPGDPRSAWRSGSSSYPGPGRDQRPGWEQYRGPDQSPRRGRHQEPSGNRPGRRSTIWIAVCAVVVLAVVGGVYAVIKGPEARAQAAGEPTASASRTPASPAGAAKGKKAAVPMPPASLGTNWKQTFSATFSGSRLKTSVWGTCYPWESQAGCANLGNTGLEYQWYLPSQDQVSGDALHLVAEQEPTIGGATEYAYRSGMVTTFPSYRFQYGYIDIVAKLPTATGLWSALWLAAANEQWPPEIDIIEHWNAQAQYWQYYHPANAPRERSVVSEPDPSGWHTFGLYWDQSEIIWYIDGHQVMKAVRNVPQQPMYFLADVAVDEQGVSLAGDSSMDIKSVRVWQRG
jgi:hypothetical protein